MPNVIDSSISRTDPADAVKSSLQSIRQIVTMARDGLTIIPVESHSAPHAADYLTLDEAQTTDAAITIDEAAQATVPAVDALTGSNKVLIIDGDTIVGGAQNRVINITLLLPESTKTLIPVSCLEQGRWNSGRRFVPGAKVDHRMRAMLAEQLGRAYRGGTEARFRSDQGAIWREIQLKHHRAAVSSPTSALHDVYRADEASVGSTIRAFPMPPSARGIAVGHHDRLVGLDLFESAETLARQWPRLIQSAVYAHVDLQRGIRSGVLPEPRHRHPDAGALDLMLGRAWEALGQPTVTKSVGLGHDVRFTGPKVVGSALVHDGRAIHIALFRP